MEFSLIDNEINGLEILVNQVIDILEPTKQAFNAIAHARGAAAESLRNKQRMIELLQNLIECLQLPEMAVTRACQLDLAEPDHFDEAVDLADRAEVFFARVTPLESDSPSTRRLSGSASEVQSSMDSLGGPGGLVPFTQMRAVKETAKESRELLEEIGRRLEVALRRCFSVFEASSGHGFLEPISLPFDMDHYVSQICRYAPLLGIMGRVQPATLERVTQLYVEAQGSVYLRHIPPLFQRCSDSLCRAVSFCPEFASLYAGAASSYINRAVPTLSRLHLPGDPKPVQARLRDGRVPADEVWEKLLQCLCAVMCADESIVSLLTPEVAMRLQGSPFVMERLAMERGWTTPPEPLANLTKETSDCIIKTTRGIFRNIFGGQRTGWSEGAIGSLEDALLQFAQKSLKHTKQSVTALAVLGVVRHEEERVGQAGQSPVRRRESEAPVRRRGSIVLQDRPVELLEVLEEESQQELRLPRCTATWLKILKFVEITVRQRWDKTPKLFKQELDQQQLSLQQVKRPHVAQPVQAVTALIVAALTVAAHPVYGHSLLAIDNATLSMTVRLGDEAIQWVREQSKVDDKYTDILVWLHCNYIYSELQKAKSGFAAAGGRLAAEDLPQLPKLERSLIEQGRTALDNYAAQSAEYALKDSLVPFVNGVRNILARGTAQRDVQYFPGYSNDRARTVRGHLRDNLTKILRRAKQRVQKHLVNLTMDDKLLPIPGTYNSESYADSAGAVPAFYLVWQAVTDMMTRTLQQDSELLRASYGTDGALDAILSDLEERIAEINGE